MVRGSASAFLDAAAAAPLDVHVDCAHGVGARALSGFAALPQLAESAVQARESKCARQCIFTMK